MVNLGRRGVVNLDRRDLVSLNRRKVVNFIGVCIDECLSEIKGGAYQDLVLKVMNEPVDEARQRLKKATLPYYTISGTFKIRNNKGLEKHSGFIAIDIDEKHNPTLLKDGPQSLKEKLSEDDYAYAAYVSASGRGLCVLVRIHPKDHDRAFQGLAYYFLDRHGVIVDACGEVSRPRYVSWDPDLYHNPDSKIFEEYPAIDKAEEKEKRDFQEPVFVSQDFEELINKLSKVNALDEYATWLPVGFALAAKFGEKGRGYFHTLSKSSPKYDEKECDRKFDNLIKSHSEEKTKRSTLASIYRLAKKHGIQIASTKTNQGVKKALTLKTVGMDPAKATAKLLEDGQSEDAAKAIIDHAFNGNMKLPGTSRVDVVETYLAELGDWKYNVILNKIELNGKPIDDRDVNEFTRQLLKMDEHISKTLIETVIASEFCQKYNPLLDFISKNELAYPPEKCMDTIGRYVDCFQTNDNPQFKRLFEKWYVSIIASIFGKYSALMLVLTGKQGTGKTEVFRRLLPEELKGYYGESRLDAGKDDHILMCQKLIICNDECGGKNRAEAKLFKEIASKQTFSLRFPFGRTNVDIHRLAVLCGTTNEKQILDDPTGNRRILPVEIENIDFEKINNIDLNKKDNVNRVAMFMEAYWLYKGGFSYALSSEEMQTLSEKTEEFEVHSPEYELINKYFKIPEGQEAGEPMTATEIKVYLENLSFQNLNINKIGAELQKIGFVQEKGRINKKNARLYRVIKKDVGQGEGLGKK